MAAASGPLAVAGAGIAGLAAALAIARKGHRVELFERAGEIAALGAGLQLSANALRVLARLGLLERLRASGVEARAVRLRSYRSGRLLAEVPVTAADGTGYLSLHRADLQAALLDAVRAEPGVALHLGATVEGVRTGPGGVDLAIRLASGERLSRRVPLLVAADGVRSAVAAALGLPPATDTGIVAARFVAAGSPAPGIEAWLGPKRHAVSYPMRGGAERNLVLIAPGAAGEDALAQGFARWDPALRAALAGADFRGVWPLLETPPERAMVAGGGRVVLLGDAAHAMLPFAAQGAAMALEDALVLAEALGPALDDLPARLARFEGARLPRLARVRARVRFHRLVYHLPAPFSLGRDAVLRLRPPERLGSDLSWLYDWAPPAGPAL